MNNFNIKKMIRLNQSIAGIIFVIIFSIIINKCEAQDLIITNNGDSIHCYVNNETSDFIWYKYKNEDESVFRLPKNEIKFIMYGNLKEQKLKSVVIKPIPKVDTVNYYTGYHLYKAGKNYNTSFVVSVFTGIVAGLITYYATSEDAVMFAGVVGAVGISFSIGLRISGNNHLKAAGINLNPSLINNY